MSLLDSIFATIRIKYEHPITVYYQSYRPIHSLEGVCFYGATWLFGVKYYETASDVEHIVSGDTTRNASSLCGSIERKRLLKYLRWTIFGVICITVACDGLSLYHDEEVFLIIDIVSFWILSLIVISTSVFMIMALTKFI